MPPTSQSRVNAGGDTLGDFFGDAIGGAWDAAADGLSEDDEIGIELPFASAAAGGRRRWCAFHRRSGGCRSGE